MMIGLFVFFPPPFIHHLASILAVTVSVKSRVVTVTGPRGTLTRAFKHINADIRVAGTPKKNQHVQVDMWGCTKVEGAAIRTIISHIKNMITGVTKVRCRR